MPLRSCPAGYDPAGIDGYLSVQTTPNGRIQGVFRERFPNARYAEAPIRIALQDAARGYRHALRLPTDRSAREGNPRTLLRLILPGWGGGVYPFSGGKVFNISPGGKATLA
jgi:hypothetical protein